MENPENMDRVLLDSIGRNEWRMLNHPFACARNPARSPRFRKLNQRSDLFPDAQVHLDRGPGPIGRDENRITIF
jgi:hypothetical protein